MNALCDFHHSGLFRSLQLLGKRLGRDLFDRETVGAQWKAFLG